MAIILQSDNDKNLESDLLLVCIPLAEVHLGFIKIILKSIITVISSLSSSSSLSSWSEHLSTLKNKITRFPTEVDNLTGLVAATQWESHPLVIKQFSDLSRKLPSLH